MSLSEQLTTPEKRGPVAADLARTLDAEVASKGGLTGAAIKTAYSGAKKKVNVETKLNENLQQIVAVFDPYWEQFDGQGDFGQFLASRGDEVTGKILGIADSRAETTSNAQFKKLYSTFRSKAGEHIKAALPAVGSCLQRHAA